MVATVASDDEITSALWNELVAIATDAEEFLDGSWPDPFTFSGGLTSSGTTLVSGAMTASGGFSAIRNHATLFALTVQNTDTSGSTDATIGGRGLRVLDPDGNDFVVTARTTNTAAAITGNDCMMVGTPLAQLPATSTFLAYKVVTGNPTGFVTSDHLMDARSGPAGDHGALRAYVIQTSGTGSDIRAFEPVAARITGAGTDWTWGTESSVNSLISPTDDFSTVGFLVKGDNVGHFGAAYPGPGATAVYPLKVGVLVWGRNGCDYYYKALDTAQAFLWGVDSNGITNSKGERPITNEVYSSGSASLRWLAVYTNNLVAELGLVGSPSITTRTGTTTGIYWPSTASLGVSIAGTLTAAVDSSGVITNKSLVLKNVVGSVPPAGYTGLSSNSDATLSITSSGSVSTQVMDSSVIGRKNRFINGDMRVKQRSTMPTTDNSYALDGMRILMASASGWTIGQATASPPTGGSGHYAEMTVGATPSTKGAIFLPIQNADMLDLRGGVCSIQARLKVSNTGIGDVRFGLIERAGATADGSADTALSFADPISAWNVAGTAPTLTDSWSYINAPANLSVTTSWATYKLENQSVNAVSQNLGLLIYVDDTSTTTGHVLSITDVQLEFGAVCSKVERQPYAAQLDTCQYYLQTVGGKSASNTFAVMGQCSSATLGEFGPVVKRRMRVSPTLVAPTVADWAIYLSASPVVTTAISLLHTSPDAVWLRATVAAGLTANAAVALGPANGAGYTQMLLTSEL